MVTIVSISQIKSWELYVNVHSSFNFGVVNMSYHPYRLQSIEDERRLLEKMLTLQDKVRKAKEKERRLKSSQSSHYTEMFQPVTNSIKNLQQRNVKVTDNQTSMVQSDTLEKPETFDEKLEDEESFKFEPGELFKTALESIPVRQRDDGVLGINTFTNRIGDYDVKINGDILQASKNGEIKSFVITDLELWKLLLVQRPNDIALRLKDNKRQPTLAVKEYIKIVDDLHLVAVAEKNGIPLKNRSKFKLLPKSFIGKGFLFSKSKPNFLKRRMIHPSTVVIPSDKKRLLRDLLKAVAELRAGNTSMQNIVQPLAQEAKRRKILPPHLLSPKEMTWVFA